MNSEYSLVQLKNWPIEYFEVELLPKDLNWSPKKSKKQKFKEKKDFPKINF